MTSLIPTNVIPLVNISVGVGSLSVGSYTYVGSFTEPLELLIFVSVCNTEIIFSFDGINDHLAVGPVANSFNDQCLTIINFKKNLITLPSPNLYAQIPAYQEVNFFSGNVYINAFSAQTA